MTKVYIPMNIDELNIIKDALELLEQGKSMRLITVEDIKSRIGKCIAALNKEALTHDIRGGYEKALVDSMDVFRGLRRGGC